MSTFLDMLLILVLLTDLASLGATRLSISITMTAVQGIALSALPFCVGEHALSLRVVLFSLAWFTMKGFVFPRVLRKVTRSAGVRHEAVPIIGQAGSIIAGVTLIAISFWMAGRIQLPVPPISRLVLPSALATILIGLLIITTRRTAINQVVGYLIMENGIYIFGVSLALEEPFVVEMGVLLDVLVAVFVMGIAIFHISREFDHIDVDLLSSLKD